MLPLNGVVVSIQVGRVAPLGPDRVPSGFVKRAVTEPVAIGLLGLVGDEQADPTVHGGPDKAVYLYAIEHYARWREAYPDHTAILIPGGFGENLTTRCLAEQSVCVGDVVGIGSAILQATQPRQPCFKLALRFADNRLPRAMVRMGLSGWYARVLKPGVIEAGDRVTILERPNPGWPIARLSRAITQHAGTRKEMSELTDLPGLPEPWRALAASALGDTPRRPIDP